MAKLRVFVSSTCYDLAVLRSELRPFLLQLGYEPIMSEYSDVLYDPRAHTHVSCVKEVPSADVVVLIIGSRFGGTAVPAALQDFDFQDLRDLSTRPEILDAKEQLSITQLEILKAVSESIPVYAFVEERVYHDHQVYEKNKDNKAVAGHIEFPSIQKKESAKYIFEFLNFLSHRTTNNTLIPFARLDDIRNHLTTQWSQLFQRLLQESRTKILDEKRYRDFSERIEDLKAVVLASLATPDLREIAKGAIQYRRLIGFISSFPDVPVRQLLLSEGTWDSLLNRVGIISVEFIDGEGKVGRSEVLLIRDDQTFFRLRMHPRVYSDFQIDWDSFVTLEEHARSAIVDALLEDREARRFGSYQMQYIPLTVEVYKRSRMEGTARNEPSEDDFLTRVSVGGQNYVRVRRVNSLDGETVIETKPIASE